jgi:hypothetical protein
VQTAAVDDVKAKVQEAADQVATTIGANLTNPAVSPATCELPAGGEEDDAVFYVQGAYQIPVAPQQQVPTLAKLRDQYKQQGYTIKDDRTGAENNTGTLTVVAPDDSFTISVQSTSPPQAVALIIHTPCYRSPTPR